MKIRRICQRLVFRKTPLFRRKIHKYCPIIHPWEGGGDPGREHLRGEAFHEADVHHGAGILREEEEDRGSAREEFPARLHSYR